MPGNSRSRAESNAVAFSRSALVRNTMQPASQTGPRSRRAGVRRARVRPAGWAGWFGAVRSGRGAAEADLVSVRIPEGGLADTGGIGLALGRLQASLEDLRDAGVEMADEQGVNGVTGMFRLNPDVQ